jgi:hypothetical protein
MRAQRPPLYPASYYPELAVRAPRRLAMRDGQFVGAPVPV